MATTNSKIWRPYLPRVSRRPRRRRRHSRRDRVDGRINRRNSSGRRTGIRRQRPWKRPECWSGGSRASRRQSSPTPRVPSYSDKFSLYRMPYAYGPSCSHESKERKDSQPQSCVQMNSYKFLRWSLEKNSLNSEFALTTDGVLQITGLSIKHWTDGRTRGWPEVSFLIATNFKDYCISSFVNFSYFFPYFSLN